MKTSKTTRNRHVPYIINPRPDEVAVMTENWRRQHAALVQTETLKPESYLPVTTGSSGRSPICFTIKSIPHSLIDGNNINISSTFNIQKFDATKKQWIDAAKEDAVIPIANTYCSMFEDMSVGHRGFVLYPPWK